MSVCWGVHLKTVEMPQQVHCSAREPVYADKHRTQKEVWHPNSADVFLFFASMKYYNPHFGLCCLIFNLLSTSNQFCADNEAEAAWHLHWMNMKQQVSHSGWHFLLVCLFEGKISVSPNQVFVSGRFRNLKYIYIPIQKKEKKRKKKSIHYFSQRVKFVFAWQTVNRK